MVIKMKNTKYDKIADNHKASETRFKNAIVSFIVGGIIGFMGEVFIEILCMYGIFPLCSGGTSPTHAPFPIVTPPGIKREELSSPVS